MCCDSSTVARGFKNASSLAVVQSSFVCFCLLPLCEDVIFLQSNTSKKESIHSKFLQCPCDNSFLFAWLAGEHFH